MELACIEDIVDTSTRRIEDYIKKNGKLMQSETEVATQKQTEQTLV